MSRTIIVQVGQAPDGVTYVQMHLGSYEELMRLTSSLIHLINARNMHPKVQIYMAPATPGLALITVPSTPNPQHEVGLVERVCAQELGLSWDRHRMAARLQVAELVSIGYARAWLN